MFICLLRGMSAKQMGLILGLPKRTIEFLLVCQNLKKSIQ